MFWAAVYSDSDSSDSSLDRRPNISGAGLGSGDGSSRPPRKSSTHKRPRRKRAAIPVATPRVPTLPSANSQSTTTNLPPSGMPLPLSARSRGSGDTTHAADKGTYSGPIKPITLISLPHFYYLGFPWWTTTFYYLKIKVSICPRSHKIFVHSDGFCF
jgi:hypothetical protein